MPTSQFYQAKSKENQAIFQFQLELSLAQLSPSLFISIGIGIIISINNGVCITIGIGIGIAISIRIPNPSFNYCIAYTCTELSIISPTNGIVALLLTGQSEEQVFCTLKRKYQ